MHINCGFYPNRLDEDGMAGSCCDVPLNNGINKSLATEYNNTINVIVNMCPPIIFNFA